MGADTYVESRLQRSGRHCQFEFDEWIFECRWSQEYPQTSKRRQDNPWTNARYRRLMGWSGVWRVRGALNVVKRV